MCFAFTFEGIKFLTTCFLDHFNDVIPLSPYMECYWREVCIIVNIICVSECCAKEALTALV